MNRFMSISVSVLGLIAVVLGVVFVYQGISKNNLIVDRMKVEKVALALDPNDPTKLTQILSGSDAQAAADVIAGHRRAIAPTYQDLLGSGKFDPTNPKHITYSQAMNLENYLYLGVTAFGLVQVVQAAGAFMIVTGLALGLSGILHFRSHQKMS